MMTSQHHTKPKRTAIRWLLISFLLGDALLVGLTLWGVRSASEQTFEVAPGAATRPTSPTLSSTTPSVAPLERAEEIPPWLATPENTPPLPAGTVAVWTVDPPPPDLSTPPPPPDEPPNPALHGAPMHNPGGVNGDRPEREAPGVD